MYCFGVFLSSFIVVQNKLYIVLVLMNDNFMICGAGSEKNTCIVNSGGRVAEWSAHRSCNPAVPGLSPALVTCLICSQSS